MISSESSLHKENWKTKKHLIIYYLFTEVGQLVLFISIKSDVTAMSQSTQE